MERSFIVAALLIVTAWLSPSTSALARVLPSPTPAPAVSIGSAPRQEQPATNADETRVTRVALWYVFKALGVLVGGMAIFLGYRLFILGVTGRASLKIQAATVGGQLVNAAPGLFFAIGGLAVVAWALWAK